MNTPLQTTLADAVDFLQSHHVPHALIGGLAVSFRGQPRATADVDIVIAVDLDRALALIGVLADSRFRPLFSDVAQVVQRSFLLPLSHRTTNVKVDLSIGLSGFEQRAVGRAEIVNVSGTRVAVATAEDLMIMKVLASRPQDELDARALAIAQGDRLDWEYCEKTAAELGKAVDIDLLTRIRALRHSPQ